ncbi:LacI family transcriptional regulator [Ornithinimicrobium sp. CNJ-824]|uniref:LacI family DNA-binding transcriptional regulator n=1 Tax=Ornithinimicrobium sp. CNJ-824 TaxID=1904966 RepID=UPI00095D6B16|nr:LacI family DNA-binding transcriptional regulator [Ornithinimicrobium sp. CNJ-824]OLT20542.1 LacI family transcriptional regulator [Ornithinimicrobium sp. CNJ-824]
MSARRPPTLEDVAARAGVSRATASRVVNGDPRVRESARTSVTAAVAELGYLPNRAARSLVVREPDSVAVLVQEPDERIFADPFFSGMLRGVSQRLAGTPLQMVLLMGEPERDAERMERYLRAGHTDGVIVVSAHRGDGLVSVLTETRLPTVFVGRPLTEDTSFAYVDVDNRDGGRLAARRLIERGCRRIGTVTGPTDMAAGIDRLAGWRDALIEAGMPTDAVQHGDFTPQGGAEAVRRLLAAHPDVDGIFVASDLMAAAAMAELQAAGRRVPQDMAIVGFDASTAAAMTRPPLTTVANPVSQMAARATELLLQLLRGEPVRPEVLPTRLVEGGTA